MQHLTLPSGASMPVIGLGTFEQLPNRERRDNRVGADTIARALRNGFRHIDSAIYYETHDEIRRALLETGVPRADVFITTKVYRDKLAYDDVLSECERSLQELGTDYLDLYLAHWPNNDIPMADTFRAMGRLLEEGIVQDIGVANFTRPNLRKALDATQTPIAINQVEYHPLLNQQALLAFCTEHGIQLTAYAPIAQARVLHEPVLQDIGTRLGKSPVQVSLRWLVQKGLSAVPKASSDAHLAANLDLFDWELSGADMRAIDTMGKNERFFNWDAVAEFSKDA